PDIDNGINTQTRSEISFTSSEDSKDASAPSILNISTSPQAETSTAATRRQKHPEYYDARPESQNRMRNKNDLISLEEPRALLEVSEDQIHYVYLSFPTPYQTYPDDANYDDNEQIIMHDLEDSVLLLPLHNMVVDNRYGSNNYHKEYKNRYLRQRVERTYAHGYVRPQVTNKPIMNPLEPGTQPEDNHFLQAPYMHFEVNSLPPQRCSSTPNPLPVQQPQPQPHQAPRAVAANPMDQLLQSMNNLILAMGNTTNQPQEAKEWHTLGGEAEPVTFGPGMTQALKKAKAAEAVYSRGGPLSSYSLKRSYLSREGPAPHPTRLKKTPTQPCSIQSDILCWQCEGRDHIARECPTKGPSNNNNGGTKQNRPMNEQESDNSSARPIMNNQQRTSQSQTNNSRSNNNPSNNTFKCLKATSRKGEGADEISSVDSSSNSAQDAIQQPIEVIYCEAAVEQHPIYLILDTESSRSLVSHEFLKRIGKDINKPSTQNLVDVYGQRKHLLGVVEDLSIEINRIKIPIDVE
ncbi:3008_t:CDS:2, partial [Dentiscutata heterogama]